MCQKKGISKSALVKEALDLFLKTQMSAYELGKDLFGVNGGHPKASQSLKKNQT